ncbi:hypothetical protein PMAYCL1PPCAC_14350, partial [Pristionchus mayeri]
HILFGVHIPQLVLRIVQHRDYVRLLLVKHRFGNGEWRELGIPVRGIKETQADGRVRFILVADHAGLTGDGIGSNCVRD